MTESVAAHPQGAIPANDPSVSSRRAAYAQILKSSAIVGGSTLVTVLVGIFRTKIMALLLGPAGVGLMGAYSSILDLVKGIAEMGVSRSGVRQIAEAAGSGDDVRLARIVIVLRRVAVVLGALGALVLLLAAAPLGRFTFGTDVHTPGVMLLSVAVFFGLVSTGQGALLQGVRRISDLAKVGIWGSVLGSVVSVVIVYFLREDGIVPAIVAITVLGCLLSWWYARRIRLNAPDMSFDVVRTEASALLRLGLAFLTSSLLMMGAAYLVRIIVLRKTGLEGAGLYQAGWTLGGLYVGFVLQAMGTDFYPRLVASVHDKHECNRLVNEQAHVSILLAGPGVLATLVLSPWLVSTFYTASFAHAAEVLRWICIGMALRVVNWPMGFIIVAKNRQIAYIATELAWTVVNLGLSWFLIEKYGLTGAGMAFFASYVFHAMVIYPVVRHMTGFTWSSETFRAMSLFVLVIGVVFLAMLVPSNLGMAIGFAALLGSCFYSIRRMLLLVDHSRLPKGVLKILSIFRVSQNDAGHP